jgi:glycerol-3-phosphate cytidylyltransferase
LNRKIIFTSGCFDLFHFGHLNILLEAKKLGSVLVVGVSTDELIESYKGIKPVVCLEDRAAIIKELRCVDVVYKQISLVDLRLFKDTDNALFALGNDWENNYENDDINWLRDNNKMVWIPYTKRLSTSKIKKDIIEMSDKITENLNKRNER